MIDPGSVPRHIGRPPFQRRDTPAVAPSFRAEIRTIRSGKPHPLDQVTRLYELIDEIQRARGPAQIGQNAVDGVRAAVGVDYCGLLIRDPAPGEARVRAWSGATAPRSALEDLPPWPRPEGDPRPVVLSPDDGAAVLDARKALSDHEIATLVRVPLLHRARVVGELVAGRRSAGLAQEEVRLIELVAAHLALSLWRTRADEDRAELLGRFEAERSVLESVVNQMPAGVLLADVPSGRIITSNPQVSAIWGRTLRHTSRITDYAMWGGRDRDGRPLEPSAWPLARAVQEGVTVRDEEIAVEGSDGGLRTIRMSAAPVRDSSGRQLGAVATVFDVTAEREKARRLEYVERATLRLNASIELGPTLTAVVDAVLGPSVDLSILYRVVDGVIDVAASAHRDAAHAAALREALEEQDPPGEGHPVWRALRGRAPILLQDPARADDDALRLGPSPSHAGLAGAPPVCEAAMVLPLSCRDRDVGVLVVARHRGRYGESDVQDLAELARHAALAMDNAGLYDEARAADRAKASFLAVMSHEFRTPLSAILGYADILMARVHGDLNATQQTHLDRVKASVRHLTFLVDEILSFASMEAGRERVIVRSTGLTELVGECASLMEPIAEAAGLRLRVTVPVDPVMVETDGPKVRQIVINLLSNALKYTEQGEVRLTLEATATGARCTVADTGRGIAPEHAEQVFEPFWQVEREGPGGTGTGLGLAVARRLARLMGGDVTLASDVGRGSEFTLELPRVARAGPDGE